MMDGCLPFTHVPLLPLQVLLMTHLMMKAGPKSKQKAVNNLNYMVGKIDGAKKGSGQPKAVKHCLVREDSSDDEDEPAVSLIKW